MTVRIPGWVLALLIVIAAGAVGAGLVLLIAGGTSTNSTTGANSAPRTSTVPDIVKSVEVSRIGIRIAKYCTNGARNTDQAVTNLEHLIAIVREDPDARLTSKSIPTTRAALVEVQSLFSLNCDPVLAKRAQQAVEGLPG